jgi:hypothetical protein
MSALFLYPLRLQRGVDHAKSEVDMSDGQKSNLPDDAVQRIVHEERVRFAIRQELERAAKIEQELGSNVWRFLNSSFGLFLLTSILVSGVGGLLTYWNQQTKDTAARYQQEKKLLAEFDFRLNDIDSKITRIAQVSDPDEKGELTNHIYSAAHGSPEFQPAVPEYKQVHMAAIVVQLDSWGLSDHAAEAIAATRDLDSGLVMQNGVVDRSPKGYRLLPLEYLQKRAKTLHQFSESAWNKLQPGRKPGIPSML